MKIVIAGAGSVGRSVALELLAHGHDITLIDNMPEKLRISSVADADWVLADACSPDALRDAGVASDELLLLVPDADIAELEDLRQSVASPVSEEPEDEDNEE